MGSPQALVGGRRGVGPERGIESVRKTYVKAPPVVVWAALHDAAELEAVLGGITIGQAGPEWPAAGAVRQFRGRVGPVPISGVIQSLEARPRSRLRLRVSTRGMEAEQCWVLQQSAGGTRVAHSIRVEPSSAPWQLLLRLRRGAIETRSERHLVSLKARAEALARAAASGSDGQAPVEPGAAGRGASGSGDASGGGASGAAA